MFKPHYDFSVTAKTVGNWGAVSSRIRRLAMTIPASRAVIRSAAERSRDRIKTNILRQAYNWQSLSPETIKTKSRDPTRDLRALIDHKTYVDAIQVVPMGPNQ